MAITLNVEPQIPPVHWNDFIVRYPSHSIALDGFVIGPPAFSNTGYSIHANFNHHEEVDRLATRATCAQVLLAIRQGLFETFQKNGQRHFSVYVNDCDEDVCTSWFLLKHGYLIKDSINPRINRLIELEDKLDTTGGAYPIATDLPFLEEMAWIYAPYRNFRASNGLSRKSSVEYEQIIEDVSMRILGYMTGETKRLPLDTRYEVLKTHPLFHMIIEHGNNARTALFYNGVKAFISVRENKTQNTWTYSIGKASMFIPMNLPRIFKALNEAEIKKRGNQLVLVDRWGGSDLIGGSPRVVGSCLTPDEVFDIIKDEHV